jgi:hypothetical protein
MFEFFLNDACVLNVPETVEISDNVKIKLKLPQVIMHDISTCVTLGLKITAEKTVCETNPQGFSTHTETQQFGRWFPIQYTDTLKDVLDKISILKEQVLTDISDWK